MLLTVTSSDRTEALRSLVDWLQREPELRGTTIRTVSVPPGPGEMGASADALQLISGNAALVTAIAGTLGVWLSTRVTRTRIRVRDGEREVEIDAGRMKSPTEVATRILRELKQPDPESTEAPPPDPAS